MALSTKFPMTLNQGLLMDKSYGGFMNSIFVSAAKSASKMLVAAASSAALNTGDGSRWRPMDPVRQFVLLTIWANVWVLRVLMEVFPPAPSNSLVFLDSGVVDALVVKQSSPISSSALVVHGGQGNSISNPASTTAIGRALSHILRILNDLPATSRKYEYVLATADRMFNENVQNGHAALLDVNRAVLSAAFSRTCELLRRSLHRSEASTAPWPSRVLKLVPMGHRLATTCYDRIRPYLAVLLPGGADTWRLPPSSSTYSKPGGHRQLALTSPVASSSEWLESEKLAHELLWITNKLRACSAAGEAIVRWGYASGLASVALTAHPRVQGSLVKITVMLYRDLGCGEWEAAREVKFGILALWLPLLCYASNGVTSPVLMGVERWEMERVVEDLIAGLPWEDQEIILRNWLEDFATSDSDWPNLQRSFDRWCRHSRKLLC